MAAQIGGFFVNRSMNYKDQFTPHKPDQYICGVYIYQTQVWCGEFEATGTELINYSNEIDSAAEWELIMQMVNVQQIYEDWYYSLKNDQ